MKRGKLWLSFGPYRVTYLISTLYTRRQTCKGITLRCEVSRYYTRFDFSNILACSKVYTKKVGIRECAQNLTQKEDQRACESPSLLAGERQDTK